MDIFNTDMRFEMEDIPPYSYPQTSLEPSSPDTTHNDYNRPVIQLQDIPALDERINGSMEFIWAEPHAILPPETSLQCPAIVNGVGIPPDQATAHNFSSCDDFSRNHNAVPTLDQPSNQRPTTPFVTRKRAPKAPTMHAKDWEPHKDRIKRLYVSEHKSIEELREIMNTELGISATLRQYKVQIQQMKIERNVKLKERKAVVKHIQHRAQTMGKKTGLTRIRGHEIDQEKLLRWAKENHTHQPFMSATPPSPLPSCISIYTDSARGSLKRASLSSPKHRRLANRFTVATDATSTPIQRLLNYAHCPKHMKESQEARAVFNDLQLILSNDYTAGKRWNEAHWNPNVTEDIIQVRNSMNLTQGLLVTGDLKEICELVSVNETRDRDADSSKLANRHAAWTTPFGKVQASFWVVSNDQSLKTLEDATTTAEKVVAARLAVVPSSMGSSPFRVLFDFTPQLNPSATITYQAMISNDSEVFKIAGSGEVKDLLKLLEEGTASLTDRDEEGRSLLSYANFNRNVDMCKFLVHKKADVNAIEPDLYGYIGPLHSGQWVLPAEATEIELHKGAQCIRIMLEAGADFSLEADHGNGEWLNGFMDAVECRSLAQFQHIVNLGEPFIDLRVNYKIPSGECSALTILADTCGYAARETIDVADKAILLLNRKADISCRNGIGDTVLHTVLRCMRLHERISRTKARRSGIVERWKLSFTAPKDLLMVFVTAGADVCATNDYGETPSMVALEYGREDEWIEALELCGYDPEVVLNSCIHYPMGEDQRSKLSFQEYCQQRQQRKHHGPFEQVDVESIENDSDNDDEQVCGEVQSEDDDDSHYDDKNAYEEDIHEETRAIADDPERIDGGSGNIGILGGYGMDIGVDNEGREHTYHAEEIFYHPVLRFDEI